MQRRQFIAATGAAMALPASAQAFLDLEYAPGTWRALAETDETVVLFFRADWSLTCQIKQDMITDLIAETPEFARLTFLDIDWDTFGPSQMAEQLKVSRRSTLIVMKRGEEIARLENDPQPDKLRSLLETALAA
jgi:thiol:disulfide interchange protein